MTYPFDITNGASLEDCHTNFFALADLNGIKWRRLSVDSIFIDPLEDPVLKSYSNCLSAGILAVWRRVLVQRDSIHQIPQESNSLSCFKELWIFWHGEEPDFTGLVESSLIEAEQGSWENGLSYECRTLLFKALHNLIERCLLSRGYTRLGRFFVEPQVLPIHRENRTQVAFALHFFLHGESTVCASIDARQASPVYILDKCHMNAAQTGQKSVKVILSPYGMEGKLTGVGYKYNDPNMARFLNNWHMFYLHPHGRAKWKINSEVPSVVEVLIGGVRMKYPASYVFVTDEDHSEAFPDFEHSARGDFVLQTMQPNLKSSNVPAPVLLTPPMSPAENSAFGDFARYNQNAPNNTLLKQHDDSIGGLGEMDYSNLLIHSACQEGYIPPLPEKADDISTLWDFHDPALLTSCTSSICTRKHSKLKSSPGFSGLDVGASNISPYGGSNVRNIRNGRLFSKIPFHHRHPAVNVLSDSQSTSKSESCKSMPMDFRTCSSNLPQLQTPFSQFKTQPASANVSGDACYSHLSSSDPVMPTLSPQPPVVKEEPYFQADEVQTQTNATSLYRDSPQGVTLKGNISDELLSPFHTSLLNSFENAKLANKKSPLPASLETDQMGDADSTADAVVSTSVICQVIEKPQLLKHSHEETFEAEFMFGLLYDYKHLASPLWQSSLPKRRCLSSQSKLDLYREEGNDSDCDIIGSSYDLDETVPCVPKDPYEFTEFDETAPSERGFRQKAEFLPKEDKFIPPTTPTSVSSSIVPVQSQENMSSRLNEDSDRELSPSATKIFCPKFIREEDLAVSLHDLDNIFDTSSSEGEDNSEMPITPSKLMAYDEFAGKIELSRMYPTPPSLEQHAVPSPYGPLTGNDTATSENDTFRDDIEVDHSSIINYDQMHIDVWYPPLITEFLESSKYAALSTLPSFIDSKSDQDLVYKPVWTHPNSRLGLNSTQECSQLLDVYHMPSQQNAMYDEEPMSSHLYSQESAPDSSFSMSNCEAVSPPSSVPSYLNKNLNSIDANMCHSVLEIHPLIVNLLLSDSLLNIFKDHNFDCCCLCVCNMNIKGSDAGIILPNTCTSWNDELQYKCTCGFSAVVHRHRSYNSGLFYEDELEVTGSVCDNASNSAYSPVSHKIEGELSESHKVTLNLDNMPGFVLDILRIQCKTLTSPFSLFHKFRLSAKKETRVPLNAVEMSDGRKICFMALEEAKMCADNLMPSKFDESWKSSCLHKWPYVSSPLPSSSQDVRLHLESLKPLLQVAVHKKNTQKIWDVTYVVTGPLTWREFHRLASRGTDDQCEPQPIPSLLLGHGKDGVALSPFALKHWDKLHLEPNSLPRDIAYIVVAPENELVLSTVKRFFRELSSTYESHNLGKHRPITKVLRDGIMRVGKTAASKVAEEPVGEWFNSIGDGPLSNKLKLYARVCKHRLAPHLSTLSLDSTIFNPATPKPSDSSAIFTPTAQFSDSSERFTIPRHSENEHPTEMQSGTAQEPAEDECHNVPALVIYIVEPFTYAQTDPDVYRLVSLGIMHSYADMLSGLPEATKNAIHLQVLSLDSIMCHGSNKPKIKRNKEMRQRKDQLKALALSVYSQSYHSSTHQLTVKSMTGFGPAAAQDKFMNNRNIKIPYALNVYNQPFVIASVKDKQTELGEMFGDRREKCGVLYCSYCLTKDKKYIIACCTNDKGEFIETTAINIGIPNRHRRKQASVRKFGLRKLLDFILEVISVSVHPWRLIIDRFGRMGHGELKAWASLLNKKSLQSYSKYLKELCNQCSISSTGDGPSILSACLVSLGPDSALRIMSDQFTQNDRFSSNRYKTCQLSTPEDATCTHILVFPTSATTQSSQVTFHQEHIDPLPGGLGEDIFEALDDDGLHETDMNDIFGMALSPQSGWNSPRRESLSQPSSPSSSFRINSSTHGDHNKCDSVLTERQDEALQLLQQPLALGYYVSTAKTGPLPKWFWASCPEFENKLPVFLKSALLIHLPFIQQSSDDLLHSSTPQPLCHPLDSNLTTDVLRYVLEGYNALSWLQLDSKYCDRRSCLPIHMQILMQLYGIVETIL